MRQRFFIAFVMLILLATQLSAQEQDYEWQFGVVQLCEREQIVHSRSLSWNPFDHTDNKTCFEFDVPVNTVAIMYAYCSRMTETSVPALQLLSGITKCVSSVSSVVNKSFGEGINRISEGLNGMSLPSGTGDVDIYLFVDPDDFLKFKEASTSDCEAKFYYPKYDLLNQKVGKKTIELNKPLEKGFSIYLGLLNKDLNDAITVRIEAVAITAKKVPIVKTEEPAVASNAMTMPTNQSDQDGGGRGFVIILIVLAVAAVTVILRKKNKSQPINPVTNKPYETPEMKQIGEMKTKVEDRIKVAKDLNIKINADKDAIKKEANDAIDALYGNYVEIPRTVLFDNYAAILTKYGDKIAETPKLQCDRNVKDAQNAISEKQKLIDKNNKVIAEGQNLLKKLQKQREIQLQIDKQKKFNKKINTSASGTEEDAASQIYGTDMMNQINNDFSVFEREIDEIHNAEIASGSIKI